MNKKIKATLFSALVLGVLCAGSVSARQLQKPANITSCLQRHMQHYSALRRPVHLPDFQRDHRHVPEGPRTGQISA